MGWEWNSSGRMGFCGKVKIKLGSGCHFYDWTHRDAVTRKIIHRVRRTFCPKAGKSRNLGLASWQKKQAFFRKIGYLHFGNKSNTKGSQGSKVRSHRLGTEHQLAWRWRSDLQSRDRPPPESQPWGTPWNLEPNEKILKHETHSSNFRDHHAIFQEWGIIWSNNIYIIYIIDR